VILYRNHRYRGCANAGAGRGYARPLSMPLRVRPTPFISAKGTAPSVRTWCVAVHTPPYTKILYGLSIDNLQSGVMSYRAV
jgi:hypothetical protein